MTAAVQAQYGKALRLGDAKHKTRAPLPTQAFGRSHSSERSAVARAANTAHMAFEERQALSISLTSNWGSRRKKPISEHAFNYKVHKKTGIGDKTDGEPMPSSAAVQSGGHIKRTLN